SAGGASVGRVRGGGGDFPRGVAGPRPIPTTPRARRRGAVPERALQPGPAHHGLTLAVLVRKPAKVGVGLGTRLQCKKLPESVVTREGTVDDRSAFTSYIKYSDLCSCHHELLRRKPCVAGEAPTHESSEEA